VSAHPAGPESADPRPVSDWVGIANEFTAVRVRRVHTRNGERLEVESRKLGTRVLLDPLEVESLTWQTPETFSRLLEHPYGPEDVATRPLSTLLGDRSEVRFPDGDDGAGSEHTDEP
jgi:hypothetical protein